MNPDKPYTVNLTFSYPEPEPEDMPYNETELAAAIAATLAKEGIPVGDAKDYAMELAAEIMDDFS